MLNRVNSSNWLPRLAVAITLFCGVLNFLLFGPEKAEISDVLALILLLALSGYWVWCWARGAPIFFRFTSFKTDGSLRMKIVRVGVVLFGLLLLLAFPHSY